MYVKITKLCPMQKENITTKQEMTPNVTPSMAGFASKELQAQKW